MHPHVYECITKNLWTNKHIYIKPGIIITPLTGVMRIQTHAIQTQVKLNKNITK